MYRFHLINYLSSNIIRSIKELKQGSIRSERDTLKKFDISSKTLRRAFDEHKNILDTYQIII